MLIPTIFLRQPCVGSILSSIVGINAHVMDPVHFPNQETNDKYLANIQRDGTFSVVPRMVRFPRYDSSSWTNSLTVFALAGCW